jgi:hypothetical protein
LVGLIAIVALTGVRIFGQSERSKVEAHAACVRSLSCADQGSVSATGALPGQGNPTGESSDGDDGGGFWGGVGDFITGGDGGKSLWDRAVDVGKGFVVDGLWGTVTGVYDMVTDPVGTAKGLWFAATHPVESFNAIKDGIVQAWNENPERLIGAGLFEVVTLPVAALKVTKATKLTKVAKVAKTVENAGDVARPAARVSSAADNAGDLGKVAKVAGKTDDPVHVATGLSRKIDQQVSKSPQLAQAVKELQADGWTIKYGRRGGGSYASRGAKEIVIDPERRPWLERWFPKDRTGTVAHEVGHAKYNPDPYVPPDGLSKSDYVAKNLDNALADEGEATLFNAEARRQILQNGGKNVDVRGLGPKGAKAVQDYMDGKITRPEARRIIGDEYKGWRTSTTHQKYDEYYGKPYEDFYDHWSQPPNGTRPP